MRGACEERVPWRRIFYVYARAPDFSAWGLQTRANSDMPDPGFVFAAERKDGCQMACLRSLRGAWDRSREHAGVGQQFAQLAIRGGQLRQQGPAHGRAHDVHKAVEVARVGHARGLQEVLHSLCTIEICIA